MESQQALVMEVDSGELHVNQTGAIPTQVGESPQPLRRGVARAAIASGATEAAARVLTVILSIATARVLMPAQVGILGLAVIVAGIISLIGACSETAGIVGRDKGSDSQHAFAATIVRLALVAVLVAVAYLLLPAITHRLAGGENADLQMQGLLTILLWVPILECAACYPRVLLQRKLELTYLAGVSLLQVIANVGLSLTLLWNGYGPVGIAWSSLIATAIAVAAVWIRMPGVERGWPGLPGAQLRRGTLINTFKVLAGGFVGYLNGRVDNLLVAGAIGPTAMGLYGMAWSASRIAPQILGQALGFVLVPALAQICDDNERVERATHESLRHSYLLLFPISAVLFVSGPSLVEFILGAKWLPIVPCLRIMSITVLAAPLVSISHALLVASGRAHITALATLGQLLVLGAFIVPLSKRWGIIGAAYGDLLAVTSLTVLALACTPTLRKVIRAAARRSMLAPLAAAGIAAAGALLLSWQVHDKVLGLIGPALILIIVYPAVLSLLGGRSALLELLDLAKGIYQRVPTAQRGLALTSVSKP